jgi:SPP1 family predicted phage head-tail adaptor
VIGHRLNSELTVYRATDTPDGAGGTTRAFASAGTIRAQVSQPSAEERTVAAQTGANLTHVVHTTRGADVERGDELDIGGARRLRVVSVTWDSRQTYTRLECEVTQGG